MLYIANAGDGCITTFDVQNRLVAASTHAGTEPHALALTPDERFLVVADGATASLAILRTDRSALVTTIPVGARPVDVVVPDWQ
jgi:DNA-binding beta-propeller fold protein YncE